MLKYTLTLCLFSSCFHYTVQKVTVSVTHSWAWTAAAAHLLLLATVYWLCSSGYSRRWLTARWCAWLWAWALWIATGLAAAAWLLRYGSTNWWRLHLATNWSRLDIEWYCSGSCDQRYWLSINRTANWFSFNNTSWRSWRWLLLWLLRTTATTATTVISKYFFNL